MFIRETISSNRIRKIYYKLIKNLAKYFIGVSKYNTIDFQNQTGNKNTMTLYSSIENKTEHEIINDDLFNKKFNKNIVSELNNPDNFKLIINGNICELKNQMLALNIMNYLINIKCINNIKLFLVGDISYNLNYYNILRRYININNIENYCYFLNSQPKPIIYKLYEKMDLSIITSRSEGLPLVLVESFCYKIPVISTNVGGIKEIINDGENGFLINGLDADKFAEIVIKLKNDKLLYSKLSEKCYISYKEFFNLEANLNKLEKLILSV